MCTEHITEDKQAWTGIMDHIRAVGDNVLHCTSAG
jgi:hypothetical protein